MAQISITEIYSGEKYGVMSAPIANYMTNGRQLEYEERTRVDILFVKYALIVVEKMRQEGDTVSGMTDDVSSSSYERRNDNRVEDLYYGSIIPQEHRYKRGSAYSEVLGYPQAS